MAHEPLLHGVLKEVFIGVYERIFVEELMAVVSPFPEVVSHAPMPAELAGEGAVEVAHKPRFGVRVVCADDEVQVVAHDHIMVQLDLVGVLCEALGERPRDDGVDLGAGA
jgi:hypothetical protein